MGREKEDRYGTCKKLQETQNADSLIYPRNFQSQLSFYVRGAQLHSVPDPSKVNNIPFDYFGSCTPIETQWAHKIGRALID